MVIRFGFNLLCRDIQAQMDFYARLLGLQEVVAVRSPIYRALQGEGFQLGFNGVAAYELLGIADRRPVPDEVAPVSGYPSLMLAQSAQIIADNRAKIVRHFFRHRNRYRCYFSALATRDAG